MEIYPEGRWKYSPAHFWRRYAEDTIPVIDYFPSFAKWMSQDAELGQAAMLVALGVCRALQWPLQPFDASFASP